MCQRCERFFCKDICWLTRASGCREMCTAGREHAAAIWRPCDCARALLGHAGRIGVRAQRSESGRGAMAARAATAAAATRAGRTLRIERAGRRGHGPMRARRAWAAASVCRKVEQVCAPGAYSAAQRRLMVWSTWPFTVLGTCKRREIRGVHSGSRWYIDGCLTPVSLA